jgi:hypothetical protein
MVEASGLRSGGKAAALRAFGHAFMGCKKLLKTK